MGCAPSVTAEPAPPRKAPESTSIDGTPTTTPSPAATLNPERPPSTLSADGQPASHQSAPHDPEPAQTSDPPTPAVAQERILSARDAQNEPEPGSAGACKYDAFLTHDWGVDGSNHIKVKEINKLLNAQGVRTWFDEERIKGHIKEEMTKGIEQSTFVVVFITERYIEKIASQSLEDNCYFEFQFACNIRADFMVPVVLEPVVRDPRAWKGLLRSHLGSNLYIDLSEITKSKVSELARRIMAHRAEPGVGATESASQKQQPAFPDPKVLEAVPGLHEKERKHLAQHPLPQVVFDKLKDPRKVLSVDEQIECISGCITVGAQRAERVRDTCSSGGPVLMVIGNTGAGKSTFVNYLHGCEMTVFKKPDGKKAIQVKDSSALAELMPIGHTNMSMTFIPGVEADSDFTYMDCPGFLDNRGAEINIANAVNIKQAIQAAPSVVIVVILNYHALLADRGRGLRDLAEILQDLFGSAERLAEHTASIALGVSRVPPRDGDGDPNSIAMVEASLKDLSGLSKSEAEVVAALRSRVFIFDPANRADQSCGWSAREDLITMLKELEPVSEPGNIFQTVLTPGDERALRGVVQELTQRVGQDLTNARYASAGSTLAQLHRIDCIENSVVTRLLNEAGEKVRASIVDLREGAAQALLFDNHRDAEDCLKSLRDMTTGLRDSAPGYAGFAEQSSDRVAAQIKNYQTTKAEREALKRELENSRLNRDLLQKQLAQLENDQATYKAEMLRLQEAMDAAKREKDTELAAAAEEFRREQEKLRDRMVSASEEDKAKLQKEIESLRSEQEQNRRNVEERAQKQEAVLKKTLEENERLQAERERERAEVRRKQEMAHREEEQKLQRVESTDKWRSEARQHQGRLQAAHRALVGKIGQEKADALLPVFDGTSWSWPSASKEMYLSHKGLGDEEAKQLAVLLEPTRNTDGTWAFNGALNTLALHYNGIGAEGAKTLAAALEPRQNPDGTWAFNGALNMLNLTDNGIGAEGAKALAAALEPRQNPDGTWAFNGALNTLDLERNEIGDEGAKALAAALEPRQNPDGTWAFNGALNKLRLEDNNIGAEGAKALSAALEPRQNRDSTWAFNGALNTLDLKLNGIGAEGGKALAAALEPRQNPDGTWAFNGALNELHLYQDQIGDEGAKALASALEPRQNPDGTWAFNGALNTLSLGLNGIGAEGGKALAAALEPRQNPDGIWAFNGALNTLYLQEINIGDEGAKALAAALEPRQNRDGTWAFNGALNTLVLGSPLRGNNIGDEGAKALVAALEPRQNPDGTWAFNGALNELRLSKNKIRDEGAKALAAALEPRQNPDGTWAFNGALNKLDLYDNNIGAEGAKALAAALEPRQNPDSTWAFNGALNNLVLGQPFGGGNNIGDEGAKALAAALEPRQNPDGTWAFNGALNELYLRGNGLSDGVKASLQSCKESINAKRDSGNNLQVYY